MSDQYESTERPTLRAVLGDVLLGNTVASSGQTLATIAVLRDALEYLEGRYARQLGRERAAREEPPAPAKKPARKEAAPGARRGRPAKRPNGAASEPTGLPFAAGEPPADVAG
jgi:hypothetical protein